MWNQTGLKISDYFWLNIFHTISTSCSMPVYTQKPDIYRCICIYMYAKPGWLHHIHQNAYQGLPAVSSCLIIKNNLVVDANGAFWTEHHVHCQSLNSYTPGTLHRLCDNINICIYLYLFRMYICCLPFFKSSHAIKMMCEALFSLKGIQ